MKVRTIRIDDYTYDKLIIMAKFYNVSINSLMVELIQIGYLVKEEGYENEK